MGPSSTAIKWNQRQHTPNVRVYWRKLMSASANPFKLGLAASQGQCQKGGCESPLFHLFSLLSSSSVCEVCAKIAVLVILNW